MNNYNYYTYESSNTTGTINWYDGYLSSTGSSLYNTPLTRAMKMQKHRALQAAERERQILLDHRSRERRPHPTALRPTARKMPTHEAAIAVRQLQL